MAFFNFSISKVLRSFHLSVISVLYEGECGTNLADVRRDPPKSPNPTPAARKTRPKLPEKCEDLKIRVLFLRHRLKTKRKKSRTFWDVHGMFG